MSGSNSLSESSVGELSSLGEFDNEVEPLEPSVKIVRLYYGLSVSPGNS